MSLLILCSCSLWAAAGCDGSGNCYVRSGAAGSNNGADWTNAFKDLPASLTRGVTYYVAAGTYKGHQFSDPDSGTTLITIQAATVANHGTSTGFNNSFVGQAVFNTNINNTGTIFIFSTDYYVINGVYRSTASGQPQTDWTLESGYGFKVDNSGKVACAAVVDLGDLNGAPVHDITVEYADINGSHETSATGCREDGFHSVYGSYNVTAKFNYIHDTGLTILYVKGNHQGTAGFGPGTNVSFTYNYFARDFSEPTQHAEGCSCSEGLTNFTIAYNYWQDINGTAVIATPSGGGYNSGNGNNGNWLIYGNVAFESSCSAVTSNGRNAGVAGFFYDFDTTFNGPLYILNNTIYNFPASCNSDSGIMLGDGANPVPMTSVFVQNNLWSQAAQVSIQNNCPTSGGRATCTSITWDHNAYFASPDNSGSNDSDPNKQVSSLNPFVNSASFIFQLASDTAAGVNTNATLAANGQDLLGTTRGSDGVWDRGAFQISGTKPGIPPGTQATAR